MISLNVPVPGQVKRIANSLGPALTAFDSVTDTHTLVCKRFGNLPATDPVRVETRVRDRLRGTPPFEIRLDGLGVFTHPVTLPAPVLYLAVESAGLVDIHESLVQEFGAVDGLEQDAYTPHITLARGATPETACRIAARSIPPVEWTVNELWLWAAESDTRISTLSLPP